MEEAFLEWERRTFARHAVLLGNPRYRLELVREAGAVAGFVGYWLLDEGIFIEHLAVDTRLRGRGVGHKAVLDILRHGKPVVLEVEPPPSALETLAENRRIRFYERLGFVRQPYAYYQPAYDGSGGKIPMTLMIHGKGVLAEEAFLRLRDALYAVVYGVEHA